MQLCEAYADENTLYTEFADLYNAFSNDRNFVEECNTLLKIGELDPKEARVLELFAGPAYHGGCFKTLGATVHCIDSSSSMKEQAVKNHGILDEEYSVGKLPEAFASSNLKPRFDLITVLRYSIGLVSPFEMEEIIQKSILLLKPNGIMALELHQIALLMSNLETLDIKDRKQSTSTQESIRCVWPSGPIKWDSNELKVEMPILLEQQTATGELIKVETTSKEWIYILRDFAFLANKHKTFKVEPLSYEDNLLNQQSKLVILRRI